MEAILMDLKRAMRSILGSPHAVSGAVRRSGVDAVSGPRKAKRRYMAPAATMRDVYGRLGKPDIYSGREMFEYYALMASRERGIF
ncbi:MAG: hypothetical protein AB1407_00050 [Spirochaetota bacterium]